MDDRELFKQAISEGLSPHFDDVVAAAPVIDPTGVILTPGDPENCAGVDECCDECDHYLTCFPG